MVVLKCCHSQPFNLLAINHRTTFTSPKCSNPLCQIERPKERSQSQRIHLLKRAACQTKCKLGKTTCKGKLPPPSNPFSHFSHTSSDFLCAACVLATLCQNIYAHENEMDAGQFIGQYRYLLYTNVRANWYNYCRNYRRTQLRCVIRLSAIIDEFLGDQCIL